MWYIEENRCLFYFLQGDLRYWDLFFGIGNEKCIKSQWDGNENVITYDIGDGYLGMDNRYFNSNSMAKNTKGSNI